MALSGVTSINVWVPVGSEFNYVVSLVTCLWDASGQLRGWSMANQQYPAFRHLTSVENATYALHGSDAILSVISGDQLAIALSQRQKRVRIEDYDLARRFLAVERWERTEGHFRFFG